jgi:imidazolonepropionase
VLFRSAGDRIVWVGSEAALPGVPATLARHVHDAERRWITPGLVDCHTHLIFAGDRTRDFEMRLNGADRAALLAAGGGMGWTIRQTRAADEETLRKGAQARLSRLMSEGITTIEIKSGYGLDVETELRQLRIARDLGRDNPITVRKTFLGAHALAPEYAGRPEDYVDYIIGTSLPAALKENLVDAVDGTFEHVSFAHETIERLYRHARSLGLPIKAHTDQYSDYGGAARVAALGGLSADHLEYVSRPSVEAMAAAGTVAVLLPGATFCLRETRMPPIDWFRECGVPMALATNCNPGSSPTTSLLLVMAMACTMFRMTPEETLRGVTLSGARALGLADSVGSLEVGKQADLVLWDIERPAELSYWLGANPCRQVVQAGRIVRG